MTTIHTDNALKSMVAEAIADCDDAKAMAIAAGAKVRSARERVAALTQAALDKYSLL